ncbi:MAG: leucyl aminopeptidase [Chloroflexi bacterium]|nr:leucyl aminopeptidase [Chloroflexota bacterium]
METRVVSGSLAEIEADLIVVSASSGEKLQGAAQQVDAVLNGALTSLIANGGFKGRLFEYEWLYPAAMPTRRILLAGAGKSDHYDLRTLRRLAGAVVRQARNKGVKRVCLALQEAQGVLPEQHAAAIIDGALTGLMEPDLYKEKSDRTEVTEIQLWVAGDEDAARRGLDRGQKIAAAINFGRWLAEEPSNIMTPVRAAEEAQRLAADNKLECEILGEEEIRSAGMNSLLSVSLGSQWPPRLVVLTYKGGGDGPTLGLVGKGVTFDSGGISIKPAADMHYMKYDMCGAAAVISTVYALAQLEAKVNVVGVAGFVENMPGGRATRPGDVVRAANGKTIEIINTDAEGRLVLADALDFARKRGANRLVDIATLTGAIKIALGTVTPAVMGSPQSWVDDLLRAAADAGERLWQMPLFPEYKDQLKSNIADLMNTGGRFGGALTAATFLQQFVADTPWAHLDIAATAWTEKDSAWQTRGATGVMIRTLIELATSSAAK